MLDIRRIRDNPDELRAALKNRGQDAGAVEEILRLDGEWRELKALADGLRASKNKVSLEINGLKKAGKGIDAQVHESHRINAELAGVEGKAAEMEGRLAAIMLTVPNIPHPSVAVGKCEDDNPVIRSSGTPRKFDFKPKEHWELATELDIMDFERGAKIAGHRFTLLKGDGAKLERAAINFFLDVHEKNGWFEVFPPLLVNEKTATGTGNLPKFADQLYYCGEDKLYLIPTAEVPVTNIYMDEIIPKEDLPMRFCAYTPCFRREAGEYGRDIKGYLRQHQFNKVELVTICEPEKSYEEHELMAKEAERVLELLGLPYNRMLLCTGDMGFAAAKTYDLNVWLPGQGKYREISSISNCEDFQARRGNTRYRDAKNKPRLVHTLNGSGIAVGRTVIAIMENYQNADGSITVPEALRPYMKGKEKIA
ncbi:MAG: serine--tRNA ligase [Candidatus ainarchaeum sp.]|nr:serine--tRNA ligase [Candidatus ainarchaeum sp.]